MRLVPFSLALLFTATPALAQNVPPAPTPTTNARPSVWNGYQRLDFILAGRPCVVVEPREPAPGRPWIWRMGWFGKDPQVDLALLARGWHLVSIDVENMYGSRRAISLCGQFYAHIVTQGKLGQRMVVEGFGRGALAAFNFAATHPSRVAALYLDSPVLDARSWPGRNRASPEWAEFLAAHDLSEQSFAAFRGNPVDRIPSVVGGKIPIIVVAGEADQLAPVAENTAVLQKRYRDQGGTIEVMLKPGAGHAPHSLPDPMPIVNFLTTQAKF